MALSGEMREERVVKPTMSACINESQRGDQGRLFEALKLPKTKWLHGDADSR